MKKLLPCTALVMCAGMACAQAEEKNDWHFNIGAMYEIENVEGYGEDMDGLAEPSVYFNAANGPWRISLAYYQEGPVDYSAGKRGTWFDRPELEVHYQFLESDDFSFGLTGGVFVIMVITTLMNRVKTRRICSAGKSRQTGM